MLRGALAAAAFLTSVPLRRRAAVVGETDLRTGLAWFPAVGGLVGLVTGAAGWLLAAVLPAHVAAVLTVACCVVVTGALHLDGLADTADGFGAASRGRNPMRVMREPGIGAFGATAIVLDLALRIAATGALLSARGFPWAIVAAAATARFSPLLVAGRLPYLHPGDGTGAWIASGIPMSHTLIAGTTAVFMSATAGPARGAAIALATLASTWSVATLARRAFGGVTGDVLGAAAELSETIALTAAAAFAPG